MTKRAQKKLARIIGGQYSLGTKESNELANSMLWAWNILNEFKPKITKEMVFELASEDEN